MAVSTISGSIRWTGLASDTDFGAVVQQLVAIERRTLTRQETWQSEWRKKLTAITNLDTRLTALKLDAQGYDARDKLLSRAASTSNDKVATMTNLATAPTGVYEVEVGENIREKIGSASYQKDKPIGCSLKKDQDGVLLGEDDKPILRPGYGGTFTGDYPDDPAFLYYVNEAGHLIDEHGELLIDSGYTGNYDIDPKTGYPLDENTGNIIYEALEKLPLDAVGEPLTITMGGKPLTLIYKADANPDEPGYYSGTFTMEDLAKAINNTVNEEGDGAPKISAAVIFDKTRDGQTFSRLVITGGEGGLANHITIKDPTNLGLDKKRFGEPAFSTLVGSSARPKITEDSAYTGHSNKTITFVAMNSGTLGERDITISWADTEGKRGSFTLTAENWQDEVKVLQGLKLDFSGGGMFMANEAFTIDCQVPVMQQAADSGLAVSDKWIHQGFSDMTSPVHYGNGGSFNFSYAGEAYSVQVGDRMSLSALADAINKLPNNPGVIASVINDGMGTATSYKLVLTGAHTGTEHGIEILSSSPDGTRTTIAAFAPDKFEHVRRAANSMTRFDGYPNDGVSWLQRPTNEVGDVIEGTVVNLTGVGRATFSIKNNVTEMANRIKALVESVNLTKTYIKQQTKFGGGKLVSNVLKDGSLERGIEGGEESGIMIGNYGFQISLSEIDRLMSRAIFSPDDYFRALHPEEKTRPGLSFAEKQTLYEKYLEDNGLLYTKLSDIGVRSDHSQGGIYVIDESRLMECLNRNPEAVIKLFTFTNDAGDFTQSQQIVHLDEQPRPILMGFCVQMGYRMHDLTRPNDVIDPMTGDIAKPAKGICKVLAENYSNIISGIDGKIAREKKRLDLYEARLTQKFARLETGLARLNGTSEKLAAQMAQLNNNNSR